MPTPHSIRGLLRHVADGLQRGAIVTLGDLMDTLGERAFGAALLLLSIPALFPLSAIPGVAVITGVPMLFFALQMGAGRDEPWLPRWLAAKPLPAGRLAALLERAAAFLDRRNLTADPDSVDPSKPWNYTRIDSLLGLLLAILAIGLMLPIPASNMVFALPITLIAIGLIETRRMWLAAGVLIGILVTLSYGYAFFFAAEWFVEFTR